MSRKFVSALVTSAAFFYCAPAKANVIYNITFFDNFSFTTTQGTGVVELNFPTVAASFNYNASLAPVLVSITTSDLNNHGAFSITPANLNAGSQFQTGNVGQVFTLTATQAGSGALSVLFLDLFTNSWQLHGGGAFGPQIDDGAFRITGPTLAPAPVPGPVAGAGLPGLMIAGGGLLAWWRRKRSDAVAAA
jgi:hypothetical protein